MARTGKAGFTLIELSVVLTIIGLLVGGVLTGQALIRQSRLNSVWTDVRRFATAVNQFDAQYNALPGDMKTATNYWGVAGGDGTGTDAGCYNTAGTGTATCNGNGNGIIGNFWAEPQEYFLVWQHLSNAGLIEGRYSGVAGPQGPGNHVPGTNCPVSRVQNSGFSFFYLPANYSDANSFPTNISHMIVFGAQSADNTHGVVLSAAEAYSLDQKYDDGLPGTGNIMTWKGGTSYTPNCATSANASTAEYNLSSAGAQCSLEINLGF